MELGKVEVLLVHDFQERIALIMLSQWRALNEANTILFNSPAGLSSNRVTVSKTRTTSSNDNAECDDGAVRKPEELGKGMDGRCASKNVGGSTSGAGGDAFARPETSLILKSVATLGITSSITLLIPTVCGKVIDLCINDPTGVSPYYAAGGLLGLTAVAGAGVVLRSRWLAIAD